MQGDAIAEVGTVPQKHDHAKNHSQIIALVGPSALFFAVFAPLVSYPSSEA
jgi:hypothetical protein